MRLWIWLCLVGGVIATQVFLWLTQIPLGIPGEWTWHRTPVEPDTGWNLVGIGVAAVLYLLFVEAGAGRLVRSRQSQFRAIELGAWLAGLVAVAIAWLWVVQEGAPIRNRLGKSAFVLYYSGSSGYFTRARYDSPNPKKFLEEYESLMREGDVLHVGTHPPGLFLVFHGMISLCQRSGWLAAVLDATQPASFREACDVIAGNARLTGQPLLLTDRRVLWLCTLLVLLAAGLSVVPLYFLLAWSHDPITAWRTAALWPAIPALAVFAPKADVPYALIGLLITWAWLCAVHRKSLVGGFLAGLLAWCGLMTSLAFLPVILFTVIVGWISILRDRSQSSAGTNGTEPPLEARGVEWPHSRRDQFQQALLAHPPLPIVGAGLAGFLIPTIMLGWCFRINLFVVWWLNYRNHAGFYAEYPRTYWKWLLENPIELVFAGGWPVALLAIAALRCMLRTGRLVSHPPAIAVVLVWGSLWLTGKNSSEAARLWIVFLPWLVWLAADRLSQWDREAPDRWIRPSTVVLALQLIASALTVTHISGFPF